MVTRKSISGASLAALVLLAGSAQAQSFLANNNATVRPGGLRTGASGLSFFNIEGTSNAANASYGVADFKPSGGTTFVAGVNTATISLVESNASFTAPGTLDFYLITDNTTNDTPVLTAPNTSSLTSNSANTTNPVGVDATQFAQGTSFYFLGSGAFTTTGNVNNGQVDKYTLNIAGAATAAQTYFIGQLATGSNLRFLITPDAQMPGVAATFAGYTNTTVAGPALTIAAAPEPGGIAAILIGVGLLGLTVIRRRCVAK